MIARTPALPTPNLFLSARLGLVSIPAAGSPASEAAMTGPGFDRDQAIALLRVLGNNLGMTILEARSEAFPEEGPVGDDPLSLPDPAVRKTLEALDMVWLKEKEAVAVFALETGLGSWEGVRRLADLLALHPKLKAAAYVVSLPRYKAELLAEIGRPVNRLLKKPLGETARILDWERLEAEVGGLGERVRYLKPEFLEGISEVVEPPAEK